jgi:hypothetical protein
MVHACVPDDSATAGTETLLQRQPSLPQTPHAWYTRAHLMTVPQQAPETLLQRQYARAAAVGEEAEQRASAEVPLPQVVHQAAQPG